MSSRAPTTTADPAEPEPIELSVGVEGMTCASCVNRIERFLRKADGVRDAHVNLATERASVSLDARIAGRDEVVAAIAAAGYDVRPETGPTDAGQSTSLALDAADPDAASRAREQRVLGIKALVSIIAAIGIMAAMLWPGGLGVATTTQNWMLLVPAPPSSSSGPAASSSALRSGWPDIALSTWTRWWPLARWRRGATASSSPCGRRW